MKKILITGAGSGLGKELALIYAEKGNHIILVGRNQKKLEDVSILLKEKGATSECLICDISNYDSVCKLKESVSKNHKSLDYLINCAGLGFFGPLADLKIEDLNMMIDINVKGTIMITKALLPIVNERLINIVSTAGLRGKPNEAAYVASKFAVRGFTESLQKELVDKELKITAVYMGGMATPFWDDSTHIKDKSRLRLPSDVAKFIKSQDDGRAEIIVE